MGQHPAEDPSWASSLALLLAHCEEGQGHKPLIQKC